MSIKETVERLAREIVAESHHNLFVKADITAIEIALCKRMAIAILTDETVGFKEALEWQAGRRDNFEQDVHWADAVSAEAKLAELKELK